MRHLTYNLLMYLLSPLWLAVTIAQSLKRKGGWHFLSTRMGWRAGAGATVECTNNESPNESHSNLVQTLWLHAASVGEVKAMLPLLDHINKAWPNLALHVTCTTPESLGILKNKNLQQFTCEYSPLDFYQSTNSLFTYLNPLALLVIETEIWPNLYRFANRHQVPLVIVNGRIGEKTLNAPPFVTNLYRQALQQVSLVLSRSTTDTANFKQLGINDDQIKTIGNIKTYTGNHTQPIALEALSGRNYLLAASTHTPEEQQLCDAFRESNLLLVIAPRHIQRSSSIQHMLTEKNISFATRSRNEPVTTATRVYLADTTGEMDNLIAGAKMVFVGGSLIDCGGHNVLEPAVQGKPVFTGIYYKNFIAEVDLLCDYNAIRIVSSANELASLCEALPDQLDELKTMGVSARQAVESSKHIFEKYTAEIDILISQWSK